MNDFEEDINTTHRTRRKYFQNTYPKHMKDSQNSVIRKQTAHLKTAKRLNRQH